jgi:hypothetical protein
VFKLWVVIPENWFLQDYYYYLVDAAVPVRVLLRHLPNTARNVVYFTILWYCIYRQIPPPLTLLTLPYVSLTHFARSQTLELVIFALGANSPFQHLNGYTAFYQDGWSSDTRT